MARYQVVIKRIVSPDGRIIAEAKSIAKASGNNKSQVSQTVSINISSDNGCRGRSTSSSRSYTK